ncbi:hypothetical protein [Streptomyces sp. NPDC085665]|uniref:hypothetical protein n=2 Tax=unclassified Streptomyces TaxID=2593676 RepID=UPI0037D2DC84
MGAQRGLVLGFNRPTHASRPSCGRPRQDHRSRDARHHHRLGRRRAGQGGRDSFLATSISFINAMAEICEKTGVDVAELADILGHDARIGRRGMRPGLGFGGGCLPKGLRGLVTCAEELGAGQAVGILREADAVNTRCRQRVIDLAREETRPRTGRQADHRLVRSVSTSRSSSAWDRPTPDARSAISCPW